MKNLFVNWLRNLFLKSDWDKGWKDGISGLTPTKPENIDYMEGYEVGNEELARG